MCLAVCVVLMENGGIKQLLKQQLHHQLSRALFWGANVIKVVWSWFIMGAKQFFRLNEKPTSHSADDGHLDWMYWISVDPNG